jgi:hypothetical protein
MPGDFKGTVFRKNQMEGYVLAWDEQLTNFIFGIYLKKTALCVYGEYVKRQIKH